MCPHAIKENHSIYMTNSTSSSVQSEVKYMLLQNLVKPQNLQMKNHPQNISSINYHSLCLNQFKLIRFQQQCRV